MEDSTLHTQALQQTPSNVRAWRWPLAVVGILGVSLTVCAITVVAAVSDPSYAIEDDYYQRAVDWDHERDLQAASDRLGWRADVIVSDDGIITAVMTDANDQPIDNAAVRVTTFHHARRGLAQDLTLQPRGNGRYVGTLAQPRSGQWQVRLRAAVGPDQFFQTQDLFTQATTP